MVFRTLLVSVCLFFSLSAVAADKADSPSPVSFTPVAVTYIPMTAEFRDYYVATRQRLTGDTTEAELAWKNFSVPEFYSIFRYEALMALREMRDYTKFLRQPLGGAEPHRLDCNRASGIGLFFVAGWSKSAKSVSKFGLRYEWQHTSLKKWKGRKKGTITSENAWRTRDPKTGRIRPMYTLMLPLDEKMRVPGTWTLTISHRGNELHREQYDFSSCGGGGSVQAA